ncbi:MAG: hypothetical protein CM15mP74_12120 [Halieaceae bacterium]|nr:MAG: hypothetical protein CM15mP74_12120 [Halieaceae bacterium]
MTEFPHVPVVVHQDHGTSPAVCQRSIQLGFSSVMMDGSLGEDGKTPWTTTTTQVLRVTLLTWRMLAGFPSRVKSVASVLWKRGSGEEEALAPREVEP